MNISFNPLTFAYIKNENKMKTLEEVIEIEQAIAEYELVKCDMFSQESAIGLLAYIFMSVSFICVTSLPAIWYLIFIK